MSVWTEAAVTAALALPARAGDVAVQFTGVSTDTRTLQAGQLFVALRGEHHDAHAHLHAAAAAGASGAVVTHIPADAPGQLRYYVVPNTLDALGRLARHRRRTLGARVCAVAGSNGKTTTKELLKAALAPAYRVHATRGNFNNLVGAPLTLLAAPADANVLVIEIGTNTPGEIAQLAAIVEPDAVVITGISAEHLEGLGDLAGVLREETAVLAWLPQGGVAVVADEPAMLAERARALYGGTQVAGLSERADEAAHGSDVVLDEDGCVRFRWHGLEVQLLLRGRHNARNALLALTLAAAWDVEPAAAVQGLAQLEPPAMRTELHRIGDLVLIADCYNANPASVEAAIDLLVSMPRRAGRVAVLGSMLELGPLSEQIHAELATAIAARELDLIVATGAFQAAFAPHAAVLGDRLIGAADPLLAFEQLRPRLAGGEAILLKGSRGVALERLLPRFEEHWGSLHPHGEALGSRVIGKSTGPRDEARPAERPPRYTSGRGKPAAQPGE